uniref:uncharacterized protein LOC120341365 n=1 Tax=Styela clava TaxID=7725 RepID=UPI00193A66E0|nr:uncharacterized protein LOC120341365 [Styela clava]
MVFNILLYCAIIGQVFASTDPELIVPETIQAFSDDVVVQTRNARIGDVVELFGNNEDEPITAQLITKSSETSTLIFNCGYFFNAGSYQFKIRSTEGEILASSRPVPAQSWPKVKIDWERTHEALTTDVKVSLTVEGKMCRSDIARQNKLYLKMKKLDNGNNKKGGLTSLIEGAQRQFKIFPVMTSSETFIPSYTVLPCEEFQNVGMYQVELFMTSPTDDVIISTSDVMNVEWSTDYNLKLLKHAFPCQGAGVIVSLSYPPCASTEDSVRLLSVSNGTMKVVDSQNRGNEDHVTFSCSSFYIMNQTVEGFCFQYVVKGGHVARTICEPVNKESGLKISGSWSPWVSWSTCKRPCQRTVSRRKRVCDNPKPRGGGEICSNKNGERSLTELAVNISDDVIPGSCYASGMTSSIDDDKQCDCGCSIKAEDKGVLVSSLTKHCKDSVIWTLRVPTGHNILFKLLDYQLARDEMLTIRDGRTSWPMTSQYPTAMSKSNIVIIQWVRSKVEDNLNSCGFILSYEPVVKPTPDARFTSIPRTTNSTLTGVGAWFEQTITNNPVVLGGIAACFLIIFIMVAVVVVHCRRKNKKSKIPPGLRTPMNTRLSMPPDGRSCSNADDTESEPMVRPRPIGNAGSGEVLPDTCIPMQPAVGSGTAYYLAQRQLELMRRLGKDEHSQTYATGCMSEENLRQQEELLFGDRRSLHKNEDLRVT